MNENTNHIIIRQATEGDIKEIEKILLDAVKRLQMMKLNNLWNEDNTQWQSLSKHYSIQQFYIAFCNDRAAGCMAITNNDSDYWPEVPLGTSNYLHKLAVQRKFKGYGIGTRLVQFAKDLTKEEGKSTLRMDCNRDRQKLRKYYESQGFQLIKEYVNEHNYPIALYLYSLNTNETK